MTYGHSPSADDLESLHDSDLHLSQKFNQMRDGTSCFDDDPFFSMRMSRPGGGINIKGDGIDDLRLISAWELADEDHDGIPDCDDNTLKSKKKKKNIFSFVELG